MKEVFGIYIVLTDPVSGYRKAAEASVRAGARYLQLRMKERPYSEVLRTAREIRAITLGSPTLFIVNDCLEAAMESDADGIHLGQDDLGPSRARERWGEPDKIFGLSVADERQAEAALQESPDYLGVGPVFATPTKPGHAPALGPERTGRIAAQSPLTAVAIGGIDALTLPELLKAGVENFACVRPVCSAPNPEKAIRDLMQLWARLRGFRHGA